MQRWATSRVVAVVGRHDVRVGLQIKGATTRTTARSGKIANTKTTGEPPVVRGTMSPANSRRPGACVCVWRRRRRTPATARQSRTPVSVEENIWLTLRPRGHAQPAPPPHPPTHTYTRKMVLTLVAGYQQREASSVSQRPAQRCNKRGVCRLPTTQRKLRHLGRHRQATLRCIARRCPTL